MRDEVQDRGERKQESVTSDRPARAASDPCYSLALTNSNLLILHPEMGLMVLKIHRCAVSCLLSAFHPLKRKPLSA